MNHNFPPHLQDTEDEVIAHLSPAELNSLSEIQGGVQTDPNRGIPTLKPLMEILSHPACAQVLQEILRPGFAHGGEVDMMTEALRRSGRMGDTMLAVIPRPIANLFDKVLNGGRAPQNHKSGKREYWFGSSLINSIGNALSPVADVVSNIAGKAYPFISQNVTPLLGGAMQAAAPLAGSAAKAGLSQWMGKYVPPSMANAFADRIGDSINSTVGQLGHGVATNFQDRDPLQIIGDQVATDAHDLAPAAGKMVGEHLGAYAPVMGQVVGQNVQDLTQGVGVPQNVAQTTGQGANDYVTNVGRQTAANVGQKMGNALQNYAAKFHSQYKPSPMGYADGGMVEPQYHGFYRMQTPVIARPRAPLAPPSTYYPN